MVNPDKKIQNSTLDSHVLWFYLMQFILNRNSSLKQLFEFTSCLVVLTKNIIEYNIFLHFQESIKFLRSNFKKS